MKSNLALPAAALAALLLVPAFGQAQNSAALTASLMPAVKISGPPGAVQLVQYSSDLTGSNGWTTIGSVWISNTNPVYFGDPSGIGAPIRFYRSQTVSLVDSNLVWIPPGTFTMGSPETEQGRSANEGPQTQVTFTRGFFMGRYLVRDAEWLNYMTNLPAALLGSSLPDSTNYALPVRSIHWTDATSYCALRTAAELAAGKIPAGWAYRLPTEVEWEYACRAGTTTAFNLGTTLRNEIGEQDACFDGTRPYPTNLVAGGGIVPAFPVTVGSYQPNGFGLYDMHGNVAEFCQDVYATQANLTGYSGGSITNPVAHVESPANYVMTRGGAFGLDGSSCRSAKRFLRPTGTLYGFIGFRVVLAPAP